ncbi:MAG: hypothetical protein MUE71_08155, partial [Chitinophagaceae bacterium]|nr:hypothetical protein [Chitinophagaceae bacterium]
PSQGVVSTGTTMLNYGILLGIVAALEIPVELVAGRSWKAAMMNKTLMKVAGAKTKNWVVNKVFSAWTSGHAPLQFAEKNFAELWKEDMERPS